MPLWFLTGLRRGVVTTRYPARPDESAASLPSPPVFDAAGALTSQTADALVRVCPSRALDRAENVLFFDVGACTACGRCRDLAPEVVTSSGEFELAATDRSALIKRIRIGVSQ